MESSEAFNTFLSWLQTEAPFRGQTNPIFINFILTVVKNDVEQAKEMITHYYTVKKRYPDMIKAIDLLDERVLRGINLGALTTDIGRSEDTQFPLVMVANFGRVSEDFEIYEATKISINVFMALIIGSKRTQKHGTITIMDFSEIPYFIILQITPSYLMQTISCLHVTGTAATKQIHLINVGYIVKAIIEATRLLLPTYINDLVYVHLGSWDSLSEYIPPESLPVEYGGTNGTIEENITDTREAALKMRDFLLENDQYGFINNGL